ncbi:Transposase [Rhizobium hainanense]|uniref:Transposase n=1 Tax=Rhizobium hainanense TaxID=52131 RepID=A0A1C3WLC8_9HYPH|nr:Transposase [Rhizobium hainanense]
MSLYGLTDFEWRAIKPVLPNERRGKPRVDDRRVVNGIFRVLRSGAPWRDVPQRYGPYATCYNRFRRWMKAGIWDSLMDVITSASDDGIMMIDGTPVRVHHSPATLRDGSSRSLSWDKSRRPDNQNPCCNRWHRAASKNRHHTRSGLRRRLATRKAENETLMGKHSAKIKPKGTDRLQPVALQEAPSHRAFLQQAKMLPTDRNPI